MSDLYLVLRSRLPEVAADWVQLGTETMKGAREAQGLSMEAAARELHVSTKTYDRREKAGRWQRHDLPNLARVVGLEIEEPERQAVTLDGAIPGDSARELLLAASAQREAAEAIADAAQGLLKASRALAKEVDRLQPPARRRVAS